MYVSGRLDGDAAENKNFLGTAEWKELLPGDKNKLIEIGKTLSKIPNTREGSKVRIHLINEYLYPAIFHAVGFDKSAIPDGVEYAEVAEKLINNRMYNKEGKSVTIYDGEGKAFENRELGKTIDYISQAVFQIAHENSPSEKRAPKITPWKVIVEKDPTRTAEWNSIDGVDKVILEDLGTQLGELKRTNPKAAVKFYEQEVVPAIFKAAKIEQNADGSLGVPADNKVAPILIDAVMQYAEKVNESKKGR